MMFETLERLAGMVQKELGEGYECKANIKTCQNGIKENQVVCKKIDNCIAPTVNVDAVMEKYNNDLEQTAKEVAEIAKAHMNGLPINTNILGDKNFVLEHAYMVLCNKEKNPDYVNDIVGFDFLDLYAMVRVRVSEEGTYLLRKDVLDKIGVTAEEVIAAARKNQEGNYGFRGMFDVLTEMMGEDYGYSPESPLVVGSSKNAVHGASIMLYADKFEHLADKAESDLYIIPSSIHEIIVIPAMINMPKEDIYKMVNEVNSTVLAPEDYLSDNVYLYERGTGEIRIA